MQKYQFWKTWHKQQGVSSAPPQKFSVNMLLFSKSSLNVLFANEVAKNVFENQYSTLVS